MNSLFHSRSLVYLHIVCSTLRVYVTIQNVLKLVLCAVAAVSAAAFIHVEHIFYELKIWIRKNVIHTYRFLNIERKKVLSNFIKFNAIYRCYCLLLNQIHDAHIRIYTHTLIGIEHAVYTININTICKSSCWMISDFQRKFINKKINNLIHIIPRINTIKIHHDRGV